MTGIRSRIPVAQNLKAAASRPLCGLTHELLADDGVDAPGACDALELVLAAVLEQDP